MATLESRTSTAPLFNPLADCGAFEIRQLYSSAWNLVLEVSRLAL
ncbi:MAG: hypothetical protein QOI73_1393 [Solirubrobacteraceae bacterium]|nr:hypothetical protein [Solirubrobacteraceae bacterium]